MFIILSDKLSFLYSSPEDGGPTAGVISTDDIKRLSQGCETDPGERAGRIALESAVLIG